MKSKVRKRRARGDEERASIADFPSRERSVERRPNVVEFGCDRAHHVAVSRRALRAFEEFDEPVAQIRQMAAGDRVIGQFRVRWIDGKPGADEVALSLGGPLPGVLAEYVIWPQQAVVKAPKHLSCEEAATQRSG